MDDNKHIIKDLCGTESKYYIKPNSAKGVKMVVLISSTVNIISSDCTPSGL